MNKIIKSSILKKQREMAKFVIPFSKEFNYISPLDLENVLESLEDRFMLNDNGVAFRKAFYNLFIKN